MDKPLMLSFFLNLICRIFYFSLYIRIDIRLIIILLNNSQKMQHLILQAADAEKQDKQEKINNDQNPLQEFGYRFHNSGAVWSSPFISTVTVMGIRCFLFLLSDCFLQKVNDSVQK